MMTASDYAVPGVTAKRRVRRGKTKKELLAEIPRYEGRWIEPCVLIKPEPDWIIETAFHEGPLDYEEANWVVETECLKMKEHLERQGIDFYSMGQELRIECITKITERMIFKYEIPLPGEIIVNLIDVRIQDMLTPF